jgi:uncharacterized protein (TIGR02996 family)
MLSLQIDFQTHLEQSPDDWEMRLVYADWLEERGESIQANGQRWQVEHKKYPENSQKQIHIRFPFTWYSYRDDPDDVPLQVLIEMDGETKDAEFREFKTQVNAETALAKALHKLEITSNCNFP